MHIRAHRVYSSIIRFSFRLIMYRYNDNIDNRAFSSTAGINDYNSLNSLDLYRHIVYFNEFEGKHYIINYHALCAKYSIHLMQYHAIYTMQHGHVF